MKKPIIIIMAAMAILTSCSSTNKSLPAGNAAETAEAEVRPESNLCGGYTRQREITPEELNLFRNTVKDDKYTPVSVATQVVAGLNYRFICKSPEGDVTITIYKPLHDAPRVTEISR